MKKQIDKLDLEILKYLEEDARKSLKKLADDLHKKTSTIYHRLQRLKATGVILAYSLILNPDFMNIALLSIEKIKMKPLNIAALDNMFFESFSKFIETEFDNVIFIGISEDSKIIYLISMHMTPEDHPKFINTLKNNPYIESVESDLLRDIVKGKKLFNFNEKWIRVKNQHEKGDLDEEEEMEEEENGDLMETSYDEEELKF